MILPVVKNPKNKFTVVTVHYSADPEKNTPEWIAEAKAGLSERGWMREYEIDYSTYAGKSFYPEFKNYNIASQEIEYNNETLYRGWDFGFHRPCVVVTKLNQFDQWCLMKSILGEDEGIRAFGARVNRYCQAEYPGAKYIDACDPAGVQKTDKSDHTSVEILNAMGIFPQYRKQEIKEGAEIIRQKLRMRADGKVGLLVDPRDTYLIDMFKGGLHYPEMKEGKTEKEFYEKEGYFEHGGDCFVAGTKVMTSEGEVNIEEIKKGTRVLTREGFNEVVKDDWSKVDTVKTVTFSDGRKLTGTLDHPI